MAQSDVGMAVTSGTLTFQFVVTFGSLAVAGLMIHALRTRVNRLWGSLSDAARTDLLTGFVNGHGINEILTNEIERARINTHRVGLITVNLNGLRQLNKQLGYEAGRRGPPRARPPAQRLDPSHRHRRPDRRRRVRDRPAADRRAHRLPARRADPHADAPRLSGAWLQPQRQHRRRRLPEARQQRRRAPAGVHGGHERRGRARLRQGRRLQPRPRGRDRGRGHVAARRRAALSSAPCSASPRCSSSATRATRTTPRSSPSTAR